MINLLGFLSGKLDTKEQIEKRMLLLSMSRKLFTHSVPLSVAEGAYEKLIKETRHLIISSKVDKKKEMAYQLLIDLIQDYNVKVLSTKIYWEKQDEKENYKKFWDKYNSIDKTTEDGRKQKEILFLQEELKGLENNLQNKHIIRFYKDKLLEYKAIRRLKNSYSKGKKYIKV